MIITNPDIYHRPLPDLPRYGNEIRQPDRLYEGAPLGLITFLDDAALTIENYCLPIEAYKSELMAAGFTSPGRPRVLGEAHLVCGTIS
jgi:hypothetical protein